ncbi:GGDEF domain-containing protein [Paenibacillus baekrokdamisoli]|nr:GGDEF domain-containing protein [Paenibacillus baekrokdamisoli]
MIQRITENWHQGGLGVIIVHLPEVGASALEALQAWSADQQRLVWRYRMESDFFFFLKREKNDERLDKLVDKSVESLRSRLSQMHPAVLTPSRGARKKQSFAIGSAVAFPSGTGRSAEAMVYYAIRDALTVVMRSQLREESAAQAEFNSMRANEPQKEWDSWDSTYAIGGLAKPIPTFYSTSRVSEVAKMFESNQHVQGAVIVNQGRPVGLVMKENMNQLLAGQFGLPLYWSRSIEKIMDDDALIVDAGLPVEQVAQLAMGRDISRLYDVVTITQNGKLLGAASIRSILEFITNLRTEEARTANPLTGLPGNASIQREMKRRIESGKPFSIIYADLDYFKWFNDFFGFSHGDELIRFLSSVLQDVTHHAGERVDFIGHIGGDDFIVLSDEVEPEKLCKQMIARFDGGVRSYYGNAQVSAVKDRSGNLIEQEGVTLSLSLLLWDGVHPITIAAISQSAAHLKKKAKSMNGSAYVIGDVVQMGLGEERS